MARVKQIDLYTWIGPRLTKKQRRRPRKNAPHGLIWSSANIGAWGQNKKFPQEYTQRGKK